MAKWIFVWNERCLSINYNNYINSDKVKILIEELDKSKENSENLIRFLRISLKKDLSVVMFYI